ncbi:MAG: hypothetical protein OS112_03790 [Methanoregula sp.]|nr:MAG: hypothetical protein OS112_03790 [Methanoregula sp.]
MEIEVKDHQDVAEPDIFASGRAGTGQENRNKTGIAGKPDTNHPQKNCRNNREIIGLGVLYNGPMHAGTLPDTSHCTGKDSSENRQERCGNRIFSCYERQERIADRLNKKIARLDHRLTKFEERRLEEWERIE